MSGEFSTTALRDQVHHMYATQGAAEPGVMADAYVASLVQPAEQSEAVQAQAVQEEQ